MDRATVDWLVSRSNLVAKLALADLEALIQSLTSSDPKEAQAILLEAVPALIDEFSAVASAEAAEWYEAIRAAQIPGYYRAVSGELPDGDALTHNVRAMSQVLFDTSKGSQEAAVSLQRLLGELVERTVKDGARSTVLANAIKDKAAKKWARVPAGTETCAFCHMVASRGWIYATAEAASKAKKNGKSFHPGCDCQIVPSFTDEDPIIEGYDPDLLYQRYLFGEKELRARFPGKRPTDDEIAALVRRLLPGIYQKGYTPNPGDIPFDQRKPALLSEKKLRHILHGDRKGGGHLHTATKKGKTRFPSWWSTEDVLEAIEDVQLHGKAYQHKETVYTYEGFSRGILLRVRIRDGEVGTAYPIRGDGVDKYFPEGNIPVPLLNFSSIDYPDVYGHRFG